MVKKIGYLAVILATIGIFSIAKAADSGENLNIPQKNGIFDVPGHPKLKAHVFVHYPKLLSKPAPTPTKMCGIADPVSSAPVSIGDWSLPSTFSYSLNPASAPSSISAANATTLSENAFNTWSNASGVTFLHEQNTSLNTQSLDHINIVAWGSTPQSALGITYVITESGKVVDLDTILNQKMAWTWSNPASWTNGETCAFTYTYDAQNILTHELGHWMGLKDEYKKTFSNNTMYGYGSMGETKKDTLTAGDIAGLKSIYGF